MSNADARRLVSMLAAAFPNPKVPRVTLELFAHELARWKDDQATKDAVEAVIRSARWWPSLAEIRELYEARAHTYAERRAADERERAQEFAQAHGLPQARREPIPAETIAWLRARGINVDGLTRVMPT